MIFFSRETSERLEKLGCKSESRHYYDCNGETRQLGHRCTKAQCKSLHTDTSWQNDLTGCHPQARENARLVWGYKLVFGGVDCLIFEEYEDSGYIPAWQYHRHAMIDAPDAEKYLEETLK